MNDFVHKHLGVIVTLAIAGAAFGARAIAADAVRPLAERVAVNEEKDANQEKAIDRMSKQVDYLYRHFGGPSIPPVDP
jgi:hypothetical protein